MRWLVMMVMALMLMLAASPAEAAAPVFAEHRVADSVLAETRGGQAFAPLTVGGTARMADDLRFADTRQVGTLVPVTFDIWFTEVGSPLIAANVRAGL